MIPGDLRSLRIRAGLTQAQSAEMVGVEERSWQRWEAGDRQMPAATAELFALLLAAGPEPLLPAGRWAKEWIRPKLRALVTPSG